MIRERYKLLKQEIATSERDRVNIARLEGQLNISILANVKKWTPFIVASGFLGVLLVSIVPLQDAVISPFFIVFYAMIASFFVYYSVFTLWLLKGFEHIEVTDGKLTHCYHLFYPFKLRVIELSKSPLIDMLPVNEQAPFATTRYLIGGAPRLKLSAANLTLKFGHGLSDEDAQLMISHICNGDIKRGNDPE